MNRKQRRAAAKQNRQSLKSSIEIGEAPPEGLSDDIAALHRKLTEAIREHKNGNTVPAEQLYREAIALKPDFAVAHNALGAALQEQGRFLEAMECYEKALELDPTLEIAKSNKAGILEIFRQKQGWQGIGQSGDHQSDAESRNVDELFQQANMLRNEGHLKEASSLFAQVLKRDNKHTGAYLNLGLTFLDMREFEAAEGILQIAVVFDPDNPNAHNYLGSAYYGLNRLEDAIGSYQKSLEMFPDNASALNNLANTYKDIGEIENALHAYDRAAAIEPRVEVLSNKLLTMHYSDTYSKEVIFSEHLKWNEFYVNDLRPSELNFDNIPDPTKRIRLGFTSGSFARHPVGYMTIAALEALDRKQFEIVIYNDTKGFDDITHRFQTTADHWVSTIGLPDQTLAQLVKKDEIDILIDLSGHAAGNRLLAFARKPAPIQVKWVGGLFNTTGMEGMDYLISDWVETPAGVDDWYTEEIIRLPNGYVCYDPPDYATDPVPLPALTNGYVTFGCFNNLTKVQPPVIALWSRILGEVENSKLILKGKQLGDEGVRKLFQEKFLAHGVEPEQLDLRGSSPHIELLQEYNDVDIALDPFPYTGGLTTVESLWMGVPVISKPGETFAARHAASHLSNVGLKDWICDDDESYVALAKRHAADLEGLADLRKALRGKVASSPLCDGEQFARDLECALRDAWVKWCEQTSAA